MIYFKSILAGLFGVLLYAVAWAAYLWFVALRPYVHQSQGMAAVAGGFSNGPWHTFSIWAFLLGAALFFAAGYYWMFRAASSR